MSHIRITLTEQEDQDTELTPLETVLTALSECGYVEMPVPDGWMFRSPSGLLHRAMSMQDLAGLEAEAREYRHALAISRAQRLLCHQRVYAQIAEDILQLIRWNESDATEKRSAVKGRPA